MPKTFNRYYEPFVGGGALLFDVQPRNAVINDSNSQLINVYRQIKENPESVIAAVNVLDRSSCDKERYLLLRKQYNAKIQARELDIECAALMIWINKHCYNGLYRVNARGLFNVSFNNQTNRVSICEGNIRNVALYLRECEVEIREGDFENACEDIHAGDFVYFDSPYVPTSKTANFTDYTKDGFKLEGHRRLAALFLKLDRLGAKLLLSNHDVPLVHELYKGYRIESVDVRRSINCITSERIGKEVLVTNY